MTPKNQLNPPTFPRSIEPRGRDLKTFFIPAAKPRGIREGGWINMVFFGTDEFAVAVLEELAKLDVKPSLVVTAEDKPKGRNLIVTPPPVKVWALAQNISFLQPAKLDSVFTNNLKAKSYKLFLVASYGKIIPKEILDIPEYGTLNIHPSLLPRLRGPSPLQTAILEENETGVTIIKLDEEIDHGPILAQKKVPFAKWPVGMDELRQTLAKEGARLFAEVLPKWLNGKIKGVPQDRSRATYTKKIKKEDGLINLNDNPEKNYRKIQAYAGWPTAYFFATTNDKKIRLIVKSARLENGKLIIEKVLPEGAKKPIDWGLFEQNLIKRLTP